MLYVGITIKDRFSNRISQHRGSERFKNDEFEVEILEECSDRTYIESREPYWISFYDSFETGLNKTAHGGGHGHGSSRFTTLGYSFSEESRAKMSSSAKAWRSKDPNSSEKASKISKDLWKDTVYRKKQEGRRRGKRLSPPKLSDAQVLEIRKRWANEKSHWIEEATKYNVKNKRYGTAKKQPESLFCDSIQPNYKVSTNQLKNIVRNKCRTEILPTLYKS